jgi:hypothetical protein
MGRSCATVAVVCGIALGLGACNSLQPKLDGKTIERAIVLDAHDQFAGTNAVVGAAHCPRNRIQRKGDHFDCHVTIDEQDVVYVVQQTDGHGTVRPSLETKYLLFSTINDQVLSSLRGQGLDDATVACGYAHVWFVTPPIKRDCVVKLSDHSTHTAHVSIAADGGVDSVTVAGLNP